MDHITINATNAAIQYAMAPERTIAYRSIGTGEPFILCNRFRGNLDDWDPAFLDAMAQHYRVITFDYSGFGSSEGAPPIDALGFATDVKDLATALGIETFLLCGWSVGGCVAQIVTTEFPELVKQTILIGTRPPGKIGYPAEPVFTQTAYKPYNDEEDNMILFFEPASEISRKAGKQSLARIAARTKYRDKRIGEDRWPHYGMCLHDFDQDKYDARGKLMTTDIPILVISPDHEVCFPPENWMELNRLLPTTQLIKIPQSGHAPHHQYPELVAAYIHLFVTHNKREGFEH